MSWLSGVEDLVSGAGNIIATIVIVFVIAGAFVSSQGANSIAFTTGNSILYAVSADFVTYLPLIVLVALLSSAWLVWSYAQAKIKSAGGKKGR